MIKWSEKWQWLKIALMCIALGLAIWWGYNIWELLKIIAGNLK